MIGTSEAVSVPEGTAAVIEVPSIVPAISSLMEGLAQQNMQIDIVVTIKKRTIIDFMFTSSLFSGGFQFFKMPLPTI
jgi:hypothetical protein